jgi:hypothetical protein
MPDTPSTNSPDSWLADREVLLHIGVHKTGTTAIQAALAAARPELRQQGVLYAGDTGSHFHAAASVVGRRLGWDDGGRVIDISRWEDLAEEARSAPGKVVLSSEVFCEATHEVAQRIATDLRPDRLRVLVTLRPLEHLLPSNWQQYVKTGLATPYDDWLRAILKGTEATGGTPSFWKRNDHGDLVRKWVDVVGPERVGVLVVDTSRPASLYESFDEIIGLSTGTLHKDESAASNRSLTASEVEVIRRLNVEIRGSMDYRVYHRLFRHGGLLELVEKRRPPADEPRLITPAWAVSRARELSAEAVETIKSTGAVVFGELSALVPDSPLPTEVAPQPDTVADEVVVRLLRGTLEAAASRMPRRAKGTSMPALDLTSLTSRDLLAEMRLRAKLRLTRSSRT